MIGEELKDRWGNN